MCPEIEYPLVSFYFSLSFSGDSSKGDASFKEVSGISMERGTEEITEGGSSYTHRVPTSVKYPNLVLKRGMMQAKSNLSKWCIDPLKHGENEYYQTKTIVLKMLNAKGKPLRAWKFVNAWPVKWSMSDLNSMNNEIVVESLEFSYSYFKRTT